MTMWFPRRGRIGIVEIFGMIRGGEQAASYIDEAEWLFSKQIHYIRLPR